ncbi:MAG TPA: magnesium transporter [Candidatus Hydrogenedentes bacterium]|nr:magnesium transporter [Candidatus Hydrogenedentota bacterium]
MVETPHSWERIEALIVERDAKALDTYLDTLSPGDVARAISRLDDNAQAELLTLLEPGDAADLIEELSDVQGADIMEEVSAATAAAIVDEMDSDHRADVLAEMDKGDAEAILRAMEPDEAADARRLLTYPDDRAGGIMMTEYVSFPDHYLVRDVLFELRRDAENYKDFSVQYVYVESDHGTLIGVLPLRDLVLAPWHERLASIMIANPIYVQVDAPIHEVDQLFSRFSFIGLPVVDENGRLVGVVRRGDAEEAMGMQTEKRFMRFSGIIGGDELRSMSVGTRVIGRLSWLTVNMMLNLMSVLVIVYFEGTIHAVVALAVVLPVICNISGCSGNQALAVSIREMALGLIQPRDLWRVVLQEVRVGVVNGVVLGTLLGGVTLLWRGNPFLGLVVGGALAMNTSVAVCLGGGIPLLLKRMGIDPALAAAPVMTTFTDMCGFFLVLSLATAALSLGVL